MKEIEINLNIEENNIKNYLKLRLWDEKIDVYEVDVKISEWFSEYLGEDLKFVRISESYQRKTNNKYIENGQTGLADEFPFLMITEKSFLYLKDSKYPNFKLLCMIENNSKQALHFLFIYFLCYFFCFF